MERKKVYVIVGQTATGKSDYAVKLAKEISGPARPHGSSGAGGEIISADSRQVYKGLNIGSGKVPLVSTPRVDSPHRVWTYKKIPHHMLDVASPKNKFTVADFQKMAFEKIEEIIARGKTPILCGGTGFYIDAVTNCAVLPSVPPDAKLRQKLATLPKEKLFQMLLKLDSARAKNIDKENPVRLIRAIEIAKTLGKVPKIKKVKSKYEFIKIGLKTDAENLKKKIHLRLAKRLKAGMLREARNLHKKGLSWKRMEELGLEYKYMALYLQKKISYAEFLYQLETAINQYAKRQMTWFKKDKEIKWINI